MMAGYGLRGASVAEARHPGPGMLECPGCRGSVRGLASGTCSICGAKNKGRDCFSVRSVWHHTLSECCEELSFEDIALASTPVAMEVDARPGRSGAAFDGGRRGDRSGAVSVAVSGGNRGAASP